MTQNTIIKLLSYGISTAAGAGVQSLWDGLREGRDHSARVADGFEACVWPGERQSLVMRLLGAWSEAWDELDTQTRVRVREGARLGVIFASTKGLVDDVIWGAEEPAQHRDPIAPVLREFLARAELSPRKSICVSNACASTLSALYLARHWLRSGVVDDVVILAADQVGPFVLKGFHCLRALTPEKVRPFAANRSGLRLGEAAAALVVSTVGAGAITLDGVGLDAAGLSVTRPAAESLLKACSQLDVFAREAPDFIVAHGTATPINDPIEDEVFSKLYGREPLITGTKWSVGHALGASGAVDLVAACEALKRREFFAIANTSEVDPAFVCRYATAKGNFDKPARYRRALVTSLGFGGIHSAVALGAVT